MKKFMFCLAVAVGMSSCAAETCYTCTQGTASCTVDICSGRATGDSNPYCSNAAAASNAANSTNEAHKTYLEQAGIGMTCVKK